MRPKLNPKQDSSAPPPPPAAKVNGVGDT
jgi:hypothetical protein